MAGTEPTREALEKDKLMLDIEKLRGDLREQDATARHCDKMFLLESRRTNMAYMAAGAGLLAGAAGLIGALLVIFNAIFK